MTDQGLKKQNEIMREFIDALVGGLSKNFSGLTVHTITEDGYIVPSNRKVTEEDILFVMREVHKARNYYETIDEVSPTYETERKDAYDNYMARAEKLNALQDRFRKERDDD